MKSRQNLIKSLARGAVLSYSESIGFPGRPAYRKFEVVVNVDPEKETITVVGLQEPQGSPSKIGMLGSSKKHEIVEIRKRLNEIKINTKIEEPLDNEGVVHRAKEALRTQTIDGEEIEKLVTLNCKQFAQYCKTGMLDRAI